MKPCLFCYSPIEKRRTFCSSKCSGQYTERQSIQKWRNGEIPGHRGVTKNIKPFVRHYLFEKYNSACCKCQWNIPHPMSGKPPLEVNHINGDADNSFEKNLELLCPNCHSLTLNFRNRNKGNGVRLR
jgi:5-methylcytosine-specific restriction endonuclease McrA